MRGLWLENNQLELLNDIPEPEIKEGEARVRVLSAGICNTDLELIRGYYPYKGILGHEFVGIVEEGPKNLINKRVVGEINAACGHCRFCLRNEPTHCENRSVLGIVNRNGAFADYLSLPTENLYPVPDNIPTEVATFTEPIAAALEIQTQIKIHPQDKVLVVGDGKLGQLVAQTLSITGCDLFAVGRHDKKLANLRARGIKTGKSEDIQERTFDIAVECTGNAQGFAMAQKALRPRGTLVLKSTYAGNLSLDASAIVVDEITLIGSRCGRFAPALELLAREQIDVQPLIDARYSLSQGIAAFERAQIKGTQKVLLNISD
ncbi:zinc-containing alcohol dehydrogenase superfamily protein [Calothrix parasitica NIES-267]|uniref:Zinc-containing alcohol dehydrogenase superfamily protein n=1 Tax=Calothrix parasitica NIES-267 TaxID=1973488 RepID=A0A1Z4LII3_9CYAN|nr:zinc-containing alcohol dehydrogenase superfamily protein [Calothrix parasitica NIES-267]